MKTHRISSANHHQILEIHWNPLSHQTKLAMLYWLVVTTPPKNMKVSWDDYSQLNGKIEVSKPPTSYNHSLTSRPYWNSPILTIIAIIATLNNQRVNPVETCWNQQFAFDRATKQATNLRTLQVTKSPTKIRKEFNLPLVGVQDIQRFRKKTYFWIVFVVNFFECKIRENM